MDAPTLLTTGASLAGLGFSLRFHWWRPQREGVPILMYHQVGEHRSGSRLNRWRVRPADFARQMDVLAARSYRVISLRQLLDTPVAPAGERRTVLTFDDGYDGVLTHALPVLRQHGYSATVFAVSHKAGGENDWDEDRPGDRLLSVDGLRALAAAGLEIGSHGARHRALTGLSDADLEDETAGSRERLAEVLGHEVSTFCYPYGAFDDRCVEAVRRAGYRAATVIRSGIAPDLSDPYRLRRVVVRGTDTLLDFRLALTRGRSKF